MPSLDRAIALQISRGASLKLGMPTEAYRLMEVMGEEPGAVLGNNQRRGIGELSPRRCTTTLSHRPGALILAIPQWTNNPLERIMREIRCRTRAGGSVHQIVRRFAVCERPRTAQGFWESRCERLLW